MMTLMRQKVEPQGMIDSILRAGKLDKTERQVSHKFHRRLGFQYRFQSLEPSGVRIGSGTSLNYIANMGDRTGQKS
jgi:hypothetical protein